MMRAGLFRDEFARFVIKGRKLVSKDTAVLRVGFPMLPNSWGEDFVAVSNFPKSFCVMVGRDNEPFAFKPYTPIDINNDHMDLLVKGYPGGRVSSDLFGLKEGESVLIRGPRDKLEIDRILANKKRLIAFAGGTGIAPIYQVIKFLNTANLGVDEIVLFYSNKTVEDILLKDELEALTSKLPAFKILNVIESEHGYIKRSDIADLHVEEDDFILVCGPKGFNEALLGRESEGILSKYKSNQIYKF